MPNNDVEMKFIDLTPTRTFGGIRLNVSANGMSISKAAYELLGSPKTVKVQVSQDGSAIKIVPNGPFVVTFSNKTREGDKRPKVNSKVIADTAQRGYFNHYQDNLFILE